MIKSGVGFGSIGLSIKPKTALIIGFVLLCLAIGPTIAIFGPRSTALVLGALVGMFLVTQAQILLSVLTVVTFVISGVFIFFLRVDIYWASYGLAGVLLGTTLLHVLFATSHKATSAQGREESQRNKLPLFLSGFFLYSLLVTILNGVGTWEFVAAVKQYFLFGGVWTALTFIEFRGQFIKAWLKGLVAIALIQLPFALYQFIFVRAHRIAAGYGEIEASDSVVGTFGGSYVSGGFTAAMATYLVCVIIVLWAFYRRGFLTTKKFSMLALVCAAPLLIMEVKAILIFIPVGILFLFKDRVRQRPMQFIGGSLLVALFVAGMIISYQVLHWSAADKELDESLPRMFSYSFTSLDDRMWDGQYRALSRLSSLQYWWQENIEGAKGFDGFLRTTFGHGIGSSHWGGQSVGAMAAKHEPLKIDYTGLTAMLWDLGVFGAVVFLLIIFYAYRLAGSLGSASFLSDWQRSLAQGLQAIVPVFLLFFVYRNDIPHASHMMFLLMGHFGLLGWLCNQGAKQD